MSKLSSVFNFLFGQAFVSLGLCIEEDLKHPRNTCHNLRWATRMILHDLVGYLQHVETVKVWEDAFGEMRECGGQLKQEQPHHSSS